MGVGVLWENAGGEMSVGVVQHIHGVVELFLDL